MLRVRKGSGFSTGNPAYVSAFLMALEKTPSLPRSHTSTWEETRKETAATSRHSLCLHFVLHPADPPSFGNCTKTSLKPLTRKKTKKPLAEPPWDKAAGR